MKEVGTPKWDNLLQRLRNNDPQLTSLDLSRGFFDNIKDYVMKIMNSSNKKTDSGTQELAEALKVNHTVISIDLSGNKLGSAEMEVLIKALKDNNHTLKFLH